MSSFKDLGLSKKILEVLENIGFETPTPIQEKAIPMLLENDPTDFIGLAQTGTGKTAAFGLPLLDLIDLKNPDPSALIMAPTRELGQQIGQQLNEFSKNNKKLNIEVVYGGAHISRQIKALKKPTQIVVATPGRLLDLIRRKAIYLENVNYVILDEADEMLNMGFKEDIDQILESTGDQKVIWLFSATMPSAIRKIIKKYMEEPLEVKVNTNQIANEDITHQYAVCKGSNKLFALRRFLDLEPDMNAVMFCRTKRDTEQFSEKLNQWGYNVAALNGDMSQGQRDKVMKRFKNKSIQLLIATDVAARGIDVKDLSHVIHHTLPDQLEYYTHRSGRTGRAGNKGISLAFISSREMRRIRELELRIKINFEKIRIPDQKEVLTQRLDNWSNTIINAEIDSNVNELPEEVMEKFEALSKEELVHKLLSLQLKALKGSGGESSDLNAEDSKSGKRKADSSQSRRSKGSDKTNRYFINLGRMDGMSKKDLEQVLSEVSGIEKKHFTNISLQKTCAYFDVDKKHEKGLSAKFDDVEVNDRSIRVNRDEINPLPAHEKKRKKHRSSGGGRGKGFGSKGRTKPRRKKSKG